MHDKPNLSGMTTMTDAIALLIIFAAVVWCAWGWLT